MLRAHPLSYDHKRHLGNVLHTNAPRKEQLRGHGCACGRWGRAPDAAAPRRTTAPHRLMHAKGRSAEQAA